MTNREKMQSVLTLFFDFEPSFTGIVLQYLNEYKLNLYELNDFYNEIHKYYMRQIQELQNNVSIAKENAYYVSTYLKGEMYKTKEAAIEALPLQIEHADRVVKLLDDK